MNLLRETKYDFIKKHKKMPITILADLLALILSRSTSMTIYTPITPTYLYIKQHSVTGLKYFGKTTKDPYTYNGSGKHWSRHIKKHGKEHILTLWVSELFQDTSIVDQALQLSEENNVVEKIDNFMISDPYTFSLEKTNLEGNKLFTYFMRVLEGVTETKIEISDLI